MIDTHTQKRKESKDNAKIDIKSQGERAKEKRYKNELQNNLQTIKCQ